MADKSNCRRSSSTNESWIFKKNDNFPIMIFCSVDENRPKRNMQSRKELIRVKPTSLLVRCHCNISFKGNIHTFSFVLENSSSPRRCDMVKTKKKNCPKYISYITDGSNWLPHFGSAIMGRSAAQRCFFSQGFMIHSYVRDCCQQSFPGNSLNCIQLPRLYTYSRLGHRLACFSHEKDTSTDNQDLIVLCSKI